ncbi:glycosyl transferase family 1 [Ensifer adhaerens]|uniref:glycosyl transferase family 1 n=1 Tax=Ensifer adhaerens TaxID=106592 RepID=UPI0023581978|nr:glycosyl transferase family 1 [Ensifer adhaerens]UAX95140.1 glycosyl transferase family 1 [Ensifer adhaerens]UAY02969.1 glycosyl transferase family 1 [Ensifer adhaerens]UAY10953.1 glycosyl transferase family 1 [Ensifer adhaerens]
MLKVLYFAQDLADPAVRRRVLMLLAGGARVKLAGFRRDANPLATISGIEPIELGTTHDGRFVQRIGAIAKSCFSLRHALRNVERPDVIIARNLDMLAVARKAVGVFGGDVPIVYECLDIHRLLLRRDLAGKAMRASEAFLGRKARLLITSSPAFVEHYFRPLSGISAPTMMLENKVLELNDATARPVAAAATPPKDRPWRIAWFGALRCRKSLALLSAFSRRMEGRFEIVLRGRPAHSEFDDFDGFVRNEPFMQFHGPYRSPEELGAIYSDVHFTWAIDFFEEGQNSKWLLPNRLYEGCRFGRVPIALRGTETSRFLAIRGLGMLLDEAEPEALVGLLGSIDPERYAEASGRIATCAAETWIFNRSDCEGLVRRLSVVVSAAPPRIAPTLSPTPQNESGLS